MKALAGNGFGGSFRYEYAFTGRLAGMADIGFISFAKKEYPRTAVSPYQSFKTTATSLMAGGKFYLVNFGKVAEGLYVSGLVGMTSLGFSLTVDKSTARSTDNNFAFAPGIGYRYRSLDLNFLQQFVSSSGRSANFSSIRIAYVITVKSGD